MHEQSFTMALWGLGLIFISQLKVFITSHSLQPRLLFTTHIGRPNDYLRGFSLSTFHRQYIYCSFSEMSRAINGTGSVPPSRSGSEPKRPITRSAGRRIRTERPETGDYQIGARIFSLWFENRNYLRRCSNAHIEATLNLMHQDFELLRQQLLHKLRSTGIRNAADFAGRPAIVYPTLGGTWQEWKATLLQYILVPDPSQPGCTAQSLEFNVPESYWRILEEAKQLDIGIQQRMRYLAALASNTARNGGNRLQKSKKRQTQVERMATVAETYDGGEHSGHREGIVEEVDQAFVDEQDRYLHSQNGTNEREGGNIDNSMALQRTIETDLQSLTDHSFTHLARRMPMENATLETGLNQPKSGKRVQEAASRQPGNVNSLATSQHGPLSAPVTSQPVSTRAPSTLASFGLTSTFQPSSLHPSDTRSALLAVLPPAPAHRVPNINVQIGPGFNVQVGLNRLLPDPRQTFNSIDSMLSSVQYPSLLLRLRIPAQIQQGIDLDRSIIMDLQSNMVYDDASLQDTLRGMWSTCNSMALAVVPNSSMGFHQPWTAGTPSLPPQQASFASDPLWNQPYQFGMGSYQPGASYQCSDTALY